MTMRSKFSSTAHDRNAEIARTARWQRRRTAVTLGAAFLVSALIASVVVQSAVPLASAQSASDDYFVEAFGDPMDFSNPEDHVIADDSMLFQARKASISGGQMHFDTDAQLTSHLSGRAIRRAFRTVGRAGSSRSTPAGSVDS